MELTMATKSTSASSRRQPGNRAGRRRTRSRMATIQWMALALVAALFVIAAFVFYGSGSALGN